jgi:predicted hydrocarbon binding protein
MVSTSTRPHEVTLPVAAIAAFRDALNSQLGADAAADALRAAGYAAGDAFHRLLSGGNEDDLRQLGVGRFWARFALLFSSRGWGQLTYSQVHPGVGALEAADWAEGRTESAADRPSCHFTTGMLANLLGQLAGSEVGVLEVECRSRGDQRCRFLFGGTEAVYAVYNRLVEGDSPDDALQRIG